MRDASPSTMSVTRDFSCLFIYVTLSLGSRLAARLGPSCLGKQCATLKDAMFSLLLTLYFYGGEGSQVLCCNLY